MQLGVQNSNQKMQSFTSSALIKGSSEELGQIANRFRIQKKAGNISGFQGMCYNGRPLKAECIDLFTVDRDAWKLNNFVIDSMSAGKNASAPNTTKAKAPLGTQTSRFQTRLAEYIDLPKTTLDAKKVLQAIQNDKFDYKELRILDEIA